MPTPVKPLPTIPYQSLEENSKHKTILLKGGPGTGKTTIAAQFPRPVIFNFDNNVTGLGRLPKKIRDGVKVIDPRMTSSGKILKGRAVWVNFIDLLALVLDDPDVDTVVIDSLTTAQEVLMDKILSSEDPAKAMQIQDWGALSRYWKTFGEEVLCQNHGKNIIVVAHERTIETKDKSPKFGLNLGGSMKDSFDLYFSDVWRTFIDIPNQAKEDVKFMVATSPRPAFMVKRSIDLPNMFEWEKEKSKVLGAIT